MFRALPAGPYLSHMHASTQRADEELSLGPHARARQKTVNALQGWRLIQETRVYNVLKDIWSGFCQPLPHSLLAAGPGRNRPMSVHRLGEMLIQSCGQSVSTPARESGRQVECPYRVAGKASALGAGSDIPKSAYCSKCASTHLPTLVS